MKIMTSIPLPALFHFFFPWLYRGVSLFLLQLLLNQVYNPEMGLYMHKPEDADWPVLHLLTGC